MDAGIQWQRICSRFILTVVFFLTFLFLANIDSGQCFGYQTQQQPLDLPQQTNNNEQIDRWASSHTQRIANSIEQPQDAPFAYEATQEQQSKFASWALTVLVCLALILVAVGITRTRLNRTHQAKLESLVAERTTALLQASEQA